MNSATARARLRFAGRARGFVWLACAVVTAVVLSPGAAPGATTYTLSADRDSYVKLDKPAENRGTETTVKIKNSSTGRRALYRFDLSGVPAGATVSSATLRVFVSGSQNNPITVHRVTDAWTETTVTWNNTGADFDASIEASFNPLVQGVYVPVDVTALVQDWMDGVVPNHGVMLIGTTGAAEVKLTSREWPTVAQRPYLDVTIADEADLAVVKTVDASVASEAQTLTYTVRVTNEGPVPANGIQVTDTLPVGLVYVSSLPSQGAYDSVTGIWNVGALGNGQVATLEIEASVGPGTAGSRITNAAARIASNPVDPDSSNDADDVAVVVSSTSSVVLPPEGSTLRRTHLEFRWLPAAGAQRYELQVVEDDGSPDPFLGGAVAVSRVVDDVAPRTLVTDGLAFDRDYAWRVRATLPVLQAWSAAQRFRIAPLPAAFTPYSVVLGPSTAPIEPGVTLFNVDFGFVAVDAEGLPVWFLQVPNRSDVRILDNGRLLYVASNRAFEASIDGAVTWASPADPELTVHHEASPMPNGNVLALVQENQQVLFQGNLQTWRGDRIVEFHKRTNNVVWSWSSFANYSTLDFDLPELQIIRGDGSHDWTHGNAVVYNPPDASVYFSARTLSRITRIDYATRQVVYDMGLAMSSGDVDFGNDLFSFQHAPDLLPNGNMMLFDNGNRRGGVVQTTETGVSKAIELSFDGEPPSGAQIVWEWTLPDYQVRVGDADRLPGGNTLVNAGVTRDIYEVDPAGELVWTLHAPGVGGSIYRAEREASLVVAARGDVDGDWDVDPVDGAALQACFTNAGPSGLGFPCTLSDLDADDDVDCDDWLALLAGWTDPAVPPDFAACPATACNDSVDNDGDGLVDLMDPGCEDASEQSETAPSFVCDDGADNDGDGLVDSGDPGCADSLDTSEHSDALPCDDGLDNDADGRADHPQDPGCRDVLWFREDPQCQDGVNNNDADGLIDFDGGISILGANHPGVTAPDANCQGRAWYHTERAGCGLGFELALVLTALRRRGRR